MNRSGTEPVGTGIARPPNTEGMNKTMNKDQLPKRKENRLRCYDYTEDGVYFLTICTDRRRPILSQIVDRSIPLPDHVYEPVPEIVLSEIGSVAEELIQDIPNRYDGVCADAYVIMPNHIHMLLQVERKGGRAMPVPTGAPSISHIIQQFKGAVTKRAKAVVWQSHFYDHVIRNETDYLACLRYIEENPLKWLLRQDEYVV